MKLLLRCDSGCAVWGSIANKGRRSGPTVSSRHIRPDSCVRTVVHGASLRTKSLGDPDCCRRTVVSENLRDCRTVSWRKTFFKVFSAQENRYGLVLLVPKRSALDFRIHNSYPSVVSLHSEPLIWSYKFSIYVRMRSVFPSERYRDRENNY